MNYQTLIKNCQSERAIQVDIIIFNRFLHDNNLVDLGYVGNPYTWHNKREKKLSILLGLIVLLLTTYG